MKLPKFNLAAMKKSCKPAMLGRMWPASRKALRLEHSKIHQFACSQWQSQTNKPSNLYLLYRWLIFISITSIGIASFACQRLPSTSSSSAGSGMTQSTTVVPQINYYKWFIYFTNWGYLMIIVQSALALAVVYKFRTEKVYSHPNEEGDDVSMPLLCSAYWLAHNIATDLAFVITLMYWTTVHDPKIHELNALNILVHGGNSVVMLCEIAVTSHPIQAAHALYGAGTGLAYGAFSMFYWVVGGTDRMGKRTIYEVLDWNKPASAFGFVSLCAVVMVLAHMFAVLLALARTQLASSSACTKSARNQTA